MLVFGQQLTPLVLPSDRKLRSFVRTVAPSTAVVDTTEVKAHLRSDDANEDTLIASYIKAATYFAENYCRRAFLTQTWRGTFSEFPVNELRLARPPLTAVTSVSYRSASGVLTTLSPSAYTVDTSSLVGSIRPAYGTVWPSTQLDATDAVVVTYTCGWSTTTIPEEAKQVVRILAAHFFERREPLITGTVVATVPFHLESLLIQLSVPEVW